MSIAHVGMAVLTMNDSYTGPENRAWWLAVAPPGWRLLGWTGRRVATFVKEGSLEKSKMFPGVAERMDMDGHTAQHIHDLQYASTKRLAGAADALVNCADRHAKALEALRKIGHPGRKISYCRDGHEIAVLIARAALEGDDNA
jgi:hypothetical protein